jgi:hypothetical protein
MRDRGPLQALKVVFGSSVISALEIGQWFAPARGAVRRFVLDRPTAKQVDQLADISRTILDSLHRS